MNILLVSQCSKNALKETRRIIDQFAERTGDRTWSTAITSEGLNTLRALLRKSARKNTSVACHCIRGKNRSELLWIVGDSTRFNESGAVPTNFTMNDILRGSDENDWNSLETIKCLASLAALFHDFGKSCADFQDKLLKIGKNEIRHEWISVVMFLAFIGDDDDAAWLKRMSDGDFDDSWIKSISKEEKLPFKKLPPLASAVCWLIVAHHRMPVPDVTQDNFLENIEADWCRSALNCAGEKKYWQFNSFITESASWRRTAAKAAAKAQKCHDLFTDKIRDPFVLNIARMALMLGDHIYSSIPADGDRVKGDSLCRLYANTDRKTKERKQLLDEHLLGVEKYCGKILYSLPKYADMLQSVGRNDILTRRNKIQKYKWQDKAFDTAAAVRHTAEMGGFFGVNMASTGCGKTIANARIMYALADTKKGCRFTVGLGLRSLTLQTGAEYGKMLGLASDELATLAGGYAVKTLFFLRDNESVPLSQDELLPSCSFVNFDGGSSDTPLGEWLSKTRGAEKLVLAPVAVCTVDHIIPASEGTAGGRQIAPMLRLMTGDLVLDEPDDYDIGDMYAFSRLVWFAGLLGCRVLLSSATVTPSIAEGLFQAYRAGRQIFNRNRGVQHSHDVVCGWFDEYSSVAEMDVRAADYAAKHRLFAEKRAKKLLNADKKRNCELVTVNDFSFTSLAATIMEKATELHEKNHSEDSQGSRVSVGLVRIANIKNLVKLIKEFCALDSGDKAFHVCCYHSRFPLIMRDEIEKNLDTILKRNSGKEIFDHTLIRKAIDNKKDVKDHIFIVFASPVAEVGRDHDYDWSIAEPSSMKSLIQLAGRVRRHRDGEWKETNMCVLNMNINAYQGENYPYSRPGYENEDFVLKNHDLNEIVDEVQLRNISSIPRIVESENPDPENSLTDLEHQRLQAVMSITGQKRVMGIDKFWLSDMYLSGYFQRKYPFRKGSDENEYVYLWDEDNEKPGFWLVDDAKEDKFSYCRIDMDDSIDGDRFFIPLDYAGLLRSLSERLGMDMKTCSERFGRFTARDKGGLCFSPYLGIFDKND